MKVQLLTDEAPEKLNRRLLKTCYTAARGCYSPQSPSFIYSKNPKNDRMIALMDEIYESGHWSVFRHASLTFSISEISRSCSHQLIRHHVGIDYEQQSQRYVKLENTTVVTPPTIQNNPEALEQFNNAINMIQDVYTTLLSLGIEAEDARFVLPNATTTNITMTINLNALINLCSERLCTLAQWEIRRLTALIRAETVKVLPWTKSYLVIKCMRDGVCFETRNKDGHCKIRPHISAVTIVPKDRDESVT